MRIALGIEYDGTAYCGWQSQHGARTVQRCVEQAVARVADHALGVVCAGRTDAGVHALGQVVHFDTDALRSTRAWVLGANANLPKDVRVLWARTVPERFHARYGALARRYRYVMLNRVVPSAIDRHRTCWVRLPLDVGRMNQAARHLLGEHDFSAYRAAACQSKTPMRRVDSLDVRSEGERVVMDVVANAFLHHMVRNVAGVLIAVGTGAQEPDWPRQVLQARDRRAGGVTASAAGLYLVGVTYPQEFGLPGPDPAPGATSAARAIR